MSAKGGNGGSHSLIVGATETGKSTLAKKIALSALKRGVPVVVYDPMTSDWGPGALVSDDWPEFCENLERASKQGKGAYVFVDEADTVLSMSHRENWWLMTRGRHFGFRVFPITQRPALVSPTVRGMCSTLYCFRVSSADAKLLSDDFTDENIRAAASLAQGVFLWSRWEGQNRKLDRYNVFT